MLTCHPFGCSSAYEQPYHWVQVSELAVLWVAQCILFRVWVIRHGGHHGIAPTAWHSLMYASFASSKFTSPVSLSSGQPRCRIYRTAVKHHNTSQHVTSREWRVSTRPTPASMTIRPRTATAAHLKILTINISPHHIDMICELIISYPVIGRGINSEVGLAICFVLITFPKHEVPSLTHTVIVFIDIRPIHITVVSICRGIVPANHQSPHGLISAISYSSQPLDCSTPMRKASFSM